MRRVDELLEEAKKLPPEARRELRDRLSETLKERPERRTAAEGPYAALLASAGSAHSSATDVARNKKPYVAEAYARRHQSAP